MRKRHRRNRPGSPILPSLKQTTSLKPTTSRKPTPRPKRPSRRRPAPAAWPPSTRRAKGRCRQGHRQGQGSRQIGDRHLQPRPLPAAEGRLQIDGLAAARREQARRGPAGGDHRLRLVIDRRLRRDLAGIQLSQPACRAVAPAVSDRRHHRHQSRPGRRGRARNDAAAADLRHRHASGPGDLAGRHQCGAAQSRSGRNRQARRRRHHAHAVGGRRRRADRPAIFAARSTSTRKAPAR